MASGSYENIDNTYVENAVGETVTFKEGIKGIRLTCENAYYYTGLDLYPVISLKRNDHTLGLIGDSSKVGLLNESEVKVTQGETEIYSKDSQGTDYIQKVEAKSNMQKMATAARNDKRKRRYLVDWRLQMQETYQDNGGTHYIGQPSGVFYDLLPSGAGLDRTSVTVKAGNQTLNSGNYTINTIENYKDSGRILLIVAINEATDTTYQVNYQTTHSYNSVQDFGKNLLNSAAYETGNEEIAGGYPDNGGKITEKSLMSSLDPGTTADRFLYAESRHNISILLSGSSGLSKLVKTEKNTDYGTQTTIGQGEKYSYQLRVANDMTMRTKDMILFDSLENFYRTADETAPTLASAWHGSLTSIDTADLQIWNLELISSLRLQQHLAMF